MVTMVTAKNIAVVFQSYVPNYSSMNILWTKFYVRIRSTDGNTRGCLLLNRACIISDVTQSIVLQFVQKL